MTLTRLQYGLIGFFALSAVIEVVGFVLRQPNVSFAAAIFSVEVPALFLFAHKTGLRGPRDRGDFVRRCLFGAPWLAVLLGTLILYWMTRAEVFRLVYYVILQAAIIGAALYLWRKSKVSA